MATRPNEFEQFMMLFRALKAKADTPRRLVTFHDASTDLQNSVQQFESFLLSTDFERRKFADRKLHRQVPQGFETDWQEYKTTWAPALSHLVMRDIWPNAFGTYDPSQKFEARTELDTPDPETDAYFNPLWHSGGAALQLGINYLEHVYETRKDGDFEDDQRIANECRITLDASDYLNNTIGLDLGAVFQRWQSLPAFFMPAAISNQHGDERGSLNDLLNDAIRA
jgi:hypothetical protein